MKLTVILVLCTVFYSKALAQKLGPQDTLLITNRTFGATDSLLQIMDGFSSNFFFQAQQNTLCATDFLKPGFVTFSEAKQIRKPFLFSALPHLGFGYGFGAQGSQLLRLDYEQAFAHHTLLNLRYDRWQRTGFMRADDLRFSGLQINLHQLGKAHEFQVSFWNASDDRQWSGGLVNYTDLNSLALDLIPVLKETARTQKNTYDATIQFRYRILGDSLKRLNLASYHAFHLQQRLYQEQGNLALFYPETFLNADTCTDTFRQQFLENRVGLNWSAPRFQVSSLLGLKQRQWADPVQSYDTLEVNWNNELFYKGQHLHLLHSNRINLKGAAEGYRTQTNIKYTFVKTSLELQHQYSNEWPLLMQRGYMSNLTNYSWSSPQKERYQQLNAYLNVRMQELYLSFNAGLAAYTNVYRFEQSSMSWTQFGLTSTGSFATASTKIRYQLGAFNLSTGYQYLAQNTAQFLPRHKASASLLWKGGVFKDKRLTMALEGKIQYQSRFQALVYLPFIESLDWVATQSASTQNGFFNAQLGMALEVKTFRFFVNVANLGSFWNQASNSIVQGYPFPPLQIRLGLTWDFWN
jgi:hypothetical protein